MPSCKTCNNSVDGRKDTTCTTCESPLHKECSLTCSCSKSLCDVCFIADGGVCKACTEGEKVEIDVIRRTYIEMYKKCPYQFYLHVIKGIEMPGTIYTQLGIDLHDLFEQDANQHMLKEEMLQHFEKIWYNYSPTLFDDQKQKEAMYKRGIDSIDTYYEVRNSLPYTPYVTEQKIEFSIGEGIPDVSITMDRIDEVDGELEMLDYKTGKVMVGKKLATDLQAPLYIYAVQQYYNKPVRKFTFYYLHENKFRVFERINEDEYVCKVRNTEYKISLTEAIREVKSLFGRIANGDFNIPRDTKGMYFTCKMCYFKQNGTCSGAEDESWKQTNKSRGANEQWSF